MSSRSLKVLSGSGAVEDLYEIPQSLSFDVPDEAHMVRTPSSAGNQKTWTQSVWVKINDIDDGYLPLYSFPGGSAYSWYQGIVYITADGDLNILDNYAAGTYGGVTACYVGFAAGLRDKSAWYHLHLIFDTTQSTNTDRIKLFVNGVRCTDTPTNTNWPAQNFDGTINSTIVHTINESQLGYYYGGWQMAEYHFIDGTAKAVTDFGETYSATGEWIPIEYEGGSYGTNGFYLKFASGALGTDSSGQGNNLTTTNLANSDVRIDSPTNNFNTLNEGQMGTYGEVNQGALRAEANTAADIAYVYGTIPMRDGSGKWYAECETTAYHESGSLVYPFPGVADITNGFSTYNPAISLYATNRVLISMENTQVSEDGSTFTEQAGMDASDGSDIPVGAIINIFVDTDNKKIWFGINGTYRGSGNPSNGTNPTFTYSSAVDLVFVCGSNKNSKGTWNFGQNGTFCGSVTAGGNSDANGIGDFKYSVPTGGKSLCTSNLPAPAIKDPSKHFNVVTYTGSNDDAVSQNVTGVGFQPDLVWIKKRSATAHHVLTDAVRGVTKAVNSSQNVAEVDDTYGVTAFGSDGFTVREQASAGGQVNTGTLVAWCWKAGGSTSANTQGDINSTVSVNNTAGFSIVTYTGDRTGAGVSTVGHGLSVAPKVVITKSRSNATNWWVQHPSTSTASKMLNLNSTAGETDKSGNGTLSRPTSTVFGTNWTDGIGTNGHTHVAYCFAEVKGFSSFGNHVGNSLADGAFANTGFRPRLVIIKGLGSGGSWFMWDTEREPFNQMDTAIWADATNGDTVHSEYRIDFVSNGFKLRGVSAGTNSDTIRYTYMAWADSPFKYANAR